LVAVSHSLGWMHCPVDLPVCRPAARCSRHLVPVDAGCEISQFHEVTSVQRKIVDLALRDYLSEGRGSDSIRERCSDHDFFADGADGQRDIDANDLIHVQLESGLQRFLESLMLHGYRVLAGL